MPHFITAPQHLQSSPKNQSQSLRTPANRQLQLRIQISNIVATMPSHQLCLQAALNIGLPANMVDFQKLLKRIESQENVNILSFTLMQIKTLLKQTKKLKQISNYVGSSMISETKQSFRRYQTLRSFKQSSLIDNFGEQKKMKPFQQKMVAAINDQMGFRIKMKNFYSTEKIERKEEYLKKKAEKAKNMNKRALKIYKNYKQQEMKSFEFFKMEKSYSSQSKQDVKTVPVPPLVEKRDFNQDQYNHLAKPISIFIEDDIPNPSIKCKTANGRRMGQKFDQAVFSILKNDSNANQQKFSETLRREMKTRQRRRQIESQKEEKLLFKLIKKQTKMKDISNSQNKQQSKIEKQNKKQKEVLTQQFITKADADEMELQIKQNCQQKQLKKQLQLQQRVNKIRQELKIKQERMERHKFRRQQQHEQQMIRNEEYLRTYMAKIKDDRQEKETKHELTIRYRHEQSQQRQQFNKMLEKISKLPDFLLNKQLKKIKLNYYSKTLKSATYLHVS